MSEMTLEQVRDWHREMERHAPLHKKAADAIDAEIKRQASARSEPVAFRCRERNGMGIWRYIEYDTRRPDSYELRECEIQNVYAAPPPEANERCESGLSTCGPVEHYDVEGVPLCAKCWAEFQAEAKGA
jgi:hypothetical protein